MTSGKLICKSDNQTQYMLSKAKLLYNKEYCQRILRLDTEERTLRKNII